MVAVETYWVNHMWKRATYYDGLAQAVLGHSINHTILLHHRLATALLLEDGLALFRRRGLRLVDASTAFATPELNTATTPSGRPEPAVGGGQGERTLRRSALLSR